MIPFLTDFAGPAVGIAVTAGLFALNIAQLFLGRRFWRKR